MRKWGKKNIFPEIVLESELSSETEQKTKESAPKREEYEKHHKPDVRLSAKKKTKDGPTV
jgi:hypothetical protein